jgi:hypothetical protein
MELFYSTCDIHTQSPRFYAITQGDAATDNEEKVANMIVCIYTNKGWQSSRLLGMMKGIVIVNAEKETPKSERVKMGLAKHGEEHEGT